MVRLPHIGSGRLVESAGELTTRKQDFNAHVEGGGFNHTANNINMNPPLSGALNSPNAQGTLENMQAYLTGINYVTIGDGSVSVGDYTVSPTKTVVECFIEAFAAPQLATGGCILMKPGVFVFEDNVILPQGVSVMGSIGGSVLSSGEGLKIGGKPLFIVPEVQDCRITELSGAPFTQWLSNGYAPNAFINLFFIDNWLFTSAGLPNLGDTNSSFIRMNNSSRVLIRDCSVVGKATIGVNEANTSITNAFVKIDDLLPGRGAVLDIQNCVIHGVQKAVSFISSTSNLNTLKFNNNRVWGMFKSDAPTIDYMVEFSACNAELCSNTFKFESMNLSTPPESAKGVCFHSMGSPVTTVDIVISNNTMDAASLSPSALQNQLVVFDTGYNQRSKVSNNSTGGVTDSFYITIGDGINNVGDLNGVDALNILSNTFSSIINGYQVPGISNIANQLTVYLHPGTYTIDNTFNPKGLGVKLIGLKQNESFPTISITDPPDPSSDTGWTMDTSSYLILGTHLENIAFTSPNADYVRIVSPVYFGYFEAGASSNNSFLVKNCTFFNVGITPKEVTHPDSSKPNPIDIVFDHCRFGSATIGSYLDWTAVLLTGGNGHYYFRNCITEQGTTQFAGYPIGVYLTELGSPDITIEDCNFATSEISIFSYWFIDLTSFANVTIKNTTIDISATSTSFYSFLNIANGDVLGKSIIIDNCKFIGNDSAFHVFGYSATGIYINEAPLFVKITNNEFMNFATAIYCSNYADYTELDVHNFFIQNNKQTFATRSSSFLILGDIENDVCPINAVVSGNIIACGASIPSEMIGYDNSITNAIINCSCGATSRAKSSIVVDNNKIYDAQTATTIATPQSAISVKGFHSTKITNNIITMTRDIAVDGYVIDCQMVDGINFVLDPHSSFYANGNHIEYNSSMDIGSNLVIPIYCRNINYVNIKDNTVLLQYAYINISNYICVFSISSVDGSTYNPVMDGIIKDNVFNNTLKYTSTWDLVAGRTSLTEAKEVLIHNEGQINDSRIHVSNNKNQKAKYDISCSKFQQYGFNTKSTPATLLMKDALIIQANSYVNNKNREAAHITNQNTATYKGGAGSYSHSNWSTLPSGLYYTNTWRTADGYHSCDPMMERTDLGVVSQHIQNQILIPLSDLPRDCELLNIDIPVYLQNLDGSNDVEVQTSASLIFGNSTEESLWDATNYMKYMTDGALIKPWAYTGSVLHANEGKKLLMNYNAFDTTIPPTVPSTNTNGSWMNDSNTRLLSNPDMYILLSLNRIINGSHLEEEHVLGFAIPYARVTIRY